MALYIHKEYIPLSHLAYDDDAEVTKIQYLYMMYSCSHVSKYFVVLLTDTSLTMMTTASTEESLDWFLHGGSTRTRSVITLTSVNYDTQPASAKRTWTKKNIQKSSKERKNVKSLGRMKVTRKGQVAGSDAFPRSDSLRGLKRF